MAGFDLSTELDPDALHFSFKPYVDAEGDIPEPSHGELRAYRQAMAKAVKVPYAEMTQDRLAEVLDQMGPEAQDKYQDAMIDAIAQLCKGTPSADHLRALPWRGLLKFQGYLFGTLADATAPLTETPSPTTRRRLEAVKNGG